MSTITIRDEYGNEFPVDASARPFWERRHGCQILDEQPAEPDVEDSPVKSPTPRKPSAGAPSNQ